MSKEWKLGIERSHGSHQLQTSWTCGSQGIVESLYAYGVSYVMLEQNYGGASKLFIPMCQRNTKMCKDKWNGLNFNYNKLSNYHKGIKHQSYFWEPTIKEHNEHDFPWQFNKCY